MKIYVWPDYSWCEVDEYCSIADVWRGDDFFTMDVPEDKLDDIDSYVIEATVK